MTTVNLDTVGRISLTLEELLTQRIAVLGVSGSGKTNTTAVIIEELLAGGVPLTICDIEGEYWGLKEKYQILIAGKGPNCELQVELEQAGTLAELSHTRRIPIILDFSEMAATEMQEFLLAYLNKLWELSGKHKQPYAVVIEEAQEFIPQAGRTLVKELVTKIALRGRKRGLMGIIVSQRSQKVDKSFLSQATLLFLHRVTFPNDIAVYKDLIPLPPREVEQIVGKLGRGEVIVLSNGEATRVQMRVRHTYHPSSNPTLDEEGEHKLLTIDKTFLAELQSSLVKTSPNLGDGDSGGGEGKLLVGRVRELEELKVVQAEEIERLKRELALVAQLKISFEGLPPGLLQLFPPPTPTLLPALVAGADKLEINTATIGKLVTTPTTTTTDNSVAATAAEGSSLSSGGVGANHHQQLSAPEREREKAISEATQKLIAQIQSWKDTLAGLNSPGSASDPDKGKGKATFPFPVIDPELAPVL